MDHYEFEILIEQRLHACLSPEDLLALDQHLATCHECRQYELRAKSEEEDLRRSISSHAERVEWHVVQARALKEMDRMRSWRYRGPILVISPILLAIIVHQFVFGGSLIYPIIGTVIVLPLYALIVILITRRAVRESEHRLADIGPIPFYREQVDRMLQGTQFVVRVSPVATTLMLLLCWYLRDRELYFWTIMFAPYHLGFTAWCYFRRLPVLRRERQELR